MKKILLLTAIICTFTVIAQKVKSSKMGQATLEVLQMTVYDKYPAAAAVVL